MRLFISIAALENWAVKTTDIKSAFLQGKELERDIYIRPPKESQTPQGLIWKLKHGLYGLKDGARQFYESVREELMKLGFTQCRLDPALFYVHKDNRLRGIICCHVDDFLHAGDELFEALMEKLRGRFSAGKVEEKEFRYIGFKVKQCENRVILDHSEYIERMKNETVDPKRATDKKEILTMVAELIHMEVFGLEKDCTYRDLWRYFCGINPEISGNNQKWLQRSILQIYLQGIMNYIKRSCCYVHHCCNKVECYF